MRSVKFWLLFQFLFALVLSAAPETTYSAGDFRRISAITCAILERNHYSNNRLSREFSAQVFDRYINTLDPMHIYLSQEDIAPFLPYRSRLVYKLQNGEYELAFQIFAVYRKNFNAYHAYVRQALQQDIDFTVDETFVIDRKKLPRPQNRAEMRQVWRKKLKYDLLVYRLMERSEKENAAKEQKKNASTAEKKKRKTPAERILQRLRDFANDINKREDIDILGIMLNAVAECYGAHSSYAPPKLSEDIDIHMSLQLIGIGATLSNENGYVKIVELVPGGPAAKSGKLKVNDRIAGVTQENGEYTDLVDMPVSKAVQFIRGKKGTRLTLDILPDNANHIVKVTLIREVIKLEESAAKGVVLHQKAANGMTVKVGVLTLPSFYMDFSRAIKGDADARRASKDVERILKNFKNQKVDVVLMDLRNNGGGSLPDCIKLTGLFLKGETVVQVATNKKTVQEKDPSKAVLYDGPMVVLCNKYSASAAEIFIGAMRDSRRAVIVGDSRTFGKGTVLTVQPLDSFYKWLGSGKKCGTLTYEIAMFYRPGGSSVQQLGIAPDIVLPSITEEMEVGEMFMDNHLPWNSITPAEPQRQDPGYSQLLAGLREASSKRVAQSKEYAAFVNIIKIFRRYRNRKEVSLNEEKRWQEYQAERKAAEAAESAAGLENKGDKKKKTKDLILGEAVNIAVDLYMSKKGK